VNLATQNLDGLPADLPVQLDQTGALPHGSASMTTGTISNGNTTKRRTRRADVPAVSGENGCGGARETSRAFKLKRILQQEKLKAILISSSGVGCLTWSLNRTLYSELPYAYTDNSQHTE